MLPDVPTGVESGLPGYEAYSWAALFAPAKTPQAVLDKINADFNTAMKDPAVRLRLLDAGAEADPGTQEQMRQRLLDAGAEADPGTQEQMRQRLRGELDKWAKVIKTAGITPG